MNAEITREQTMPSIKNIRKELESFIVTTEKKIPLFGYPLISYNQNFEGYDRITYLWDQITKLTISRSSKSNIMKDLIDSYKGTERVQKYVLNSFTAGKKISSKLLNSQIDDEDFDPFSKMQRKHISEIAKLNKRKIKGVKLKTVTPIPNFIRKNTMILSTSRSKTNEEDKDSGI